MNHTLTKLIEVLEQDERLVVDGKLAKNKVVELALELDVDLLRLLKKSKELVKVFFQEVDGILIFDKVKFQSFVSNKQFLPGSFTEYKNKIGLMAGKQYLTDNNEVVLAFPYKDCVLEGGQEKDEAKRNEVFWNETLAPDEVDRLLKPKVLTNIKKYTADGEQKIDEINDTDNLIIKGNNLIVMHTLKKKFAGKVKLIYIDPPYNTGSDSFGYNDSFNHSTWLTFMKNRLEIAKKFLTMDGCIAVQCSFHEQAYLKVLMDGIFPKYLCTLNIQVRHPDRILTGDKEFNDVVEYIHLYSVNKDMMMPKKVEDKVSDEYLYEIIETGVPETLEMDGKLVKVFTPDKVKIEKLAHAFTLFKKISVRGSIREKNSSGRFYVKHLEALKGKYPAETIFRVPSMGDDAFGDRYFYMPANGKLNGGYFQGKPQSSDTTSKPYANFMNFEKEYNNVSNQGGVSFRNGKKPEELIEAIINMFTNKDSIVMDYHLGSGSTCAVAHKMGRQYIGIEQLDYAENNPEKRLQNVIAGDDSGISKSVAWNGGGSFVYAELAKANQTFVDVIQDAKTTKDLAVIWEKMKETAFLSYKIDVKEIDGTKKEWSSLSLDDQKRFLIAVLEKNWLYVPYSEIDDERFAISENVKKLNRKFYE